MRSACADDSSPLGHQTSEATYPAICRRDFGHELPPDGRADPVGGDHQIEGVPLAVLEDAIDLIATAVRLI